MLHVVATPIGNLADLSPRALAALRGAAAIACEDTRRTWQLLTHFEIPRPAEMFSYRQGNEERVTEKVLSLLSEEGFELTDEQLEAITGGSAGEWSLEKLLASFGDTLAGLFPEGFDPKVIWSNIPTLGVH
mgnify:CR=1 FL=1